MESDEDRNLCYLNETESVSGASSVKNAALLNDEADRAFESKKI